MSEETTTEPNVMAGDVITQPGLYESRGGDIMPIIGWGEGWWVSELNGTRDWYGSDGRQRFRAYPEKGEWDLERWVAPLPASELEPQPEAQPPMLQPEPVQVCEGRWRTRGGEIRDVTPTPPGRDLEDGFPWWDGSRTFRNDGRYAVHENAMDLLEYLGAIEPQPEPQPQPQPQPIQVCEGRWKTRGGDIRNVTPTPEGDGREERFPWWDAAHRQTWTSDGRYHFGGESPLDLVEYLGTIEEEPQPEPVHTADELRSEIHYLQKELGEAKVELAGAIQGRDLFAAANREQADKIGALQGEAHVLNMEIGGLERQLAVAKAELKTAAAVGVRLQIELDAAQQVPADSPQLRQLRLDLAEVTLHRDQYKTAYDQIFADLVTIRETTAADTVEAIVEWLQPFRGCNSPSLALLLLEALPHIMRSLTGLADEEIE